MKRIPLTQGQFAIVDDEDFERLSQFKWYVRKLSKSVVCYAVRHDRQSSTDCLLTMQNAVLGVPRGVLVDHKDRNGLNNTRSNLRICTKGQNQRNQGIRRDNTSGFKGVCRHRARWEAKIMLNGVKKHLGTFDTPEEAAKAYDKAARELHGEFAYLNFED
jgi:hypothetical protein